MQNMVVEQEHQTYYQFDLPSISGYNWKVYKYAYTWRNTTEL